MGRSYHGKYRGRFLQSIAADVDVVFVDGLRIMTDQSLGYGAGYSRLVQQRCRRPAQTVE